VGDALYAATTTTQVPHGAVSVGGIANVMNSPSDGATAIIPALPVPAPGAVPAVPVTGIEAGALPAPTADVGTVSGPVFGTAGAALDPLVGGLIDRH
jgi:hypothetical protein